MRRVLPAVALLVVWGAAPSTRAQGPETRSRFVQAHWESLRLRALDLWVASGTKGVPAALPEGGDPALRGLPIHQMVELLVALEGRERESLLRARHGILPMILPQVLDLDAAARPFGVTNLTLHQPEPMALPAPAAFEFLLERSGGPREAPLHTRILQPRDPRGALSSYGVSVRLPEQAPEPPLAGAPRSEPAALLDLADGSYTWRVSIHLDSQPPGPGDPSPGGQLWVRRGFVRELGEVDQWLQQLDPQSSEYPWIAGLAEVPRRVLMGLPAAPHADPIRALDRLLQWRALAADRLEDAVQAWVSEHRGWVPIRLPDQLPVPGKGAVTGAAVATAPAFGLVRLPIRNGAPLILGHPGAPTWDMGGRRPLAPLAPDLFWIAAGVNVVAPPSRDGAAPNVALLPGVHRLTGGPNRQRRAAEFLQQRCGTPAGRGFLVAARDAATVFGFGVLAAAADSNPEANTWMETLGGLVLVDGGALNRAALEALPPIPVDLVCSPGAPGGRALLRTKDLADGRYGEVRTAATLEVLGVEGQGPWFFAFPRGMAQGFKRATAVAAPRSTAR